MTRNAPQKFRPAQLRRSVALLALAGVVLFLQRGSFALDNQDPLKQAMGFLITGDYLAAGVNLTGAEPVDPDGLSTGTITINPCSQSVTTNCIPQNADILAAYLYWEVIHDATVAPSNIPAKLNGSDVRLTNGVFDAKRVQSVSATEVATSTCWSSSQVPLLLTHFRADVLHKFLPVGDTGKRNVTGSHTVHLPLVNGNQIPESAGATLSI